MARSNSCFGCCSIRSGITYIYVFNLLWTTLMIMNHIMDRLSNYHQFTENYIFSNNSTEILIPIQYPNNNSVQLQHNSTTLGDFKRKIKSTPLMNIYMNYIFILTSAWRLLEFYLNVHLKQSTYQVSIENVYAWLVIYYGKLCEYIIFQIIVIVANWSSTTEWIEHIVGIMAITIIGIELYVVHIHYSQQKLAAITNIVDVRWKYVPKPKIPSNHIMTTTRAKMTRNINQTTEDDDESADYIPIFVKKIRNTNSENITTGKGGYPVEE